MRILVSGSGGFVGRHLLPHLRSHGHDVVALRRGGQSGEDAFAGPADLAAIEDFSGWPGDVEAVVHLAALNPRRGDPRRRNEAALRHANVDAAAALARRAAREGVRRVVLLSSASVHAPAADGRASSEDDAPAPRSPYARSKAEAEIAFREALAGSATTGIVLRPVPVFGPGARNLTSTLTRLARTPLFLPLGGLGTARSLIGVGSLAEAIRLALSVRDAANGTFVLADDGPLSPAGIVAAWREGAKRPARLLPAPVSLLRFAARRAERSGAIAAMEEGLVVDTARARAALGWRPDNAREALARMAAGAWP